MKSLLAAKVPVNAHPYLTLAKQLINVIANLTLGYAI